MTAPKTRPRKPRSPKSPTASEIAPGVFVGGWKDAVRFDGVRFCVLDEAPADMPTATHIPIYRETTDSVDRPNLDRLARSVEEARKRGQPVLIFCGMGVRRSPLGAAWYLHSTAGLPLDEAYDRIRSVRPKVEHVRTWVGDTSALE
jgi:protein-tyrosine phosphatase